MDMTGQVTKAKKKAENRKKKCVQLITDLIAFLLLVALDQMTKYIAVGLLKGRDGIELIPRVFELRYLENRGAAFGMLQDGRVFFIFTAIVMMTVIIFVLVKTPAQKKYRPWHVFLVTIAAGGIGNMIDRLLHGYVIDFFYISLINFPIFNVADLFVTFGTLFLAIYLLFFCKEDELKFISLSLQKK
jgi:signal peptidase II